MPITLPDSSCPSDAFVIILQNFGFQMFLVVENASLPLCYSFILAYPNFSGDLVPKG